MNWFRKWREGPRPSFLAFVVGIAGTVWTHGLIREHVESTWLRIVSAIGLPVLYWVIYDALLSLVARIRKARDR
jgi:hypothetical protein